MFQNTLSLSLYHAAIGSAIDWAQVATVVIAGVGIVMAVLIVLIIVFNGFGKFVSSLEASAKNRAARKAAKKAEKTAESTQAATPAVKVAPPVAQAPVAPAPVVEAGISGEVVAAITAVIAAQEGNNQFMIRSVKKKDVGSRNPWARAAVAENTRGF